MSIDEKMYRTNGFRILGLDIDSSHASIENSIVKIEFYRSTNNFKDYEPLEGVFDKSETVLLLPARPEPSYNEYQNAKNRLYDVERRFMDELFWFWPQTPDKRLDEEIVEYLKEDKCEKAIKYWEDRSNTNPINIVAIHNLAVLYHMMALEGFYNGIGDKNLFDDLELSFKYWFELLGLDTFKDYVKQRAYSINDPRLNEEFIDEVFDKLPENLLNINYIYIKKYLNSEKWSIRKLKYIYRHIDCIKNSPFDKAIIGRFSSKIIDEIEKRIKENEEKSKEDITFLFDEQVRYNIIVKHYEKILPYLKILQQSFKDDVISECVLNDSCDFIYYKIPTASNISSLKSSDEEKYYKYIKILESLDEYVTKRKLSEKIQSDLSDLKPLEAVEHSIDVSVCDCDGNALSDVNVRVTHVDAHITYTTTTDSSGTCKISKLPTGKYQYTIEKKGYKSDDGTKDVQEDSNLTIRLRKEKPKIKEYSLDININDINGNTLSDVNVSISNIYTDKTYTCTTDSSGFCKIKLPIGKYNYKVQKNGYYSNKGTIDVQEESNLNLRLKKKFLFRRLRMK